MDIRKIKTLIEMLEESNLNEIEVSQGDESVRISKGKDPTDYIENNQINTSISSQEKVCLLYTSPSPRDGLLSRMPSSA